MTAVDAAEAIDQWTPLLMSICWEWSGRSPWLADDFLSDASITLWRAFLAFDQTRGHVSSGFVATVVKRAIWCRLQKERSSNPIAFRDQFTIIGADGEELQVVEVVPAGEPDVSIRVEIADLMSRLTPDQAERIERHFLNGEPTAEIAADKGVSESAVSQTIRNGLAKLRAVVET